jgi:nitrate reductase NapA
MAPLEVLKKESGMIWPFVEGKPTKWRFNSKYDPACETEGFHFYGNEDGRATIWQRPYEPAAESPDDEYPFWLNTGRVVEHWHSGSMTRRISVLHKAMPNSYVELNPEEAKKMGIKNKDKVKLTTRRGSIVMLASVNERGIPPKGQVFVPFFDEHFLINEITLDSYCPISNEPDYKKCAVKVEKV